MRRRIKWNEGDSSPDFDSIILNVNGSGSIQIETSFPTSAATVSFSRTYMENILDSYGNMTDIFISVGEVNDTGFVLDYENVPNDIPLEVNYYAM